MTYALVLFLMLGGHMQSFVVDHGLTADDCRIEQADNAATPMQCLPQR